MIKRLIRATQLMLAIILVLTGSCKEKAYAAEENNPQVTLSIYHKDGSVTIIGANRHSDEINEHNSKIYDKEQTRGSTAPSKEKDIAGHPYYYTIVGMHHHVYSDYYFSPDSNGCLAISTDTLDSSGDQIRIILCRKRFLLGPEEMSVWVTDPQAIQGLGYSNLSTSDYYFFKFETLSTFTEVNGYGYIHHPGDSIPTP